MFLNKTRLKKWVKDAYNRSGLIVGRVYGGLVVSGGTWITWTMDGYVPNWAKAAVMEYTGELPKPGCVFKAKKDEPIQYEIAENDLLNLPEVYQKAKVPFIVTPIVYDDKWNEYRFVQNRDLSTIYAVSTYLYDVLDLRELGEESRPTGPVATSDSGDMLLWKNEQSALAIFKMNISSDTVGVMDILETYSFKEEAI